MSHTIGRRCATFDELARLTAYVLRDSYGYRALPIHNGIILPVFSNDHRGNITTTTTKIQINTDTFANLPPEECARLIHNQQRVCAVKQHGDDTLVLEMGGGGPGNGSGSGG